jgi:hypothetical protein
MHETNCYGAWQAAANVDPSYQPMTSIDDLRSGGRYRILTPDDYVAELSRQGEAPLEVLHPMVGGIPPDLAWRHLHLFEEAFLR